MARGVNKVILVGNCGQDPETKYMPSGNAVTNISIATSEAWKDKQTGQQQERTEWHRVVFFNRLAEVAGEYLRKGSKVYVEGSLRTRKWQDQSGQDRYTTEIVGSEMQMLDSRSGGMDAGMAGSGMGMSTQQAMPVNPSQQNVSQQQNVQQGAPQQGVPQQGVSQQGTSQQSAAQQSTSPAPGFDNFDDDIPF